ncbi:MAG: bifunctional 4-hydroxy-2-oxoglutarate aldolase/2-dehydro-3-deoxy-phosphogluconate aldolase [Lentisphaeraceae bacterium]|nr:bifunctional 4-hydroxy-2-oxoglutarate aldolase/2-dehydro-3-deoxy-phosphogluconate aldolase [Lentisphaeraceae bacterium]
MTEFSWDKFNKHPVVGILRGFNLAETIPLLEVLIEEDWPSIEVTMNTEDAAGQIEALVKSYGSKINIGAGTVTTMAELNAALNAGANFIVTPIVNVEIIKKCVALSTPVFPGAFSPTEIFAAWEAGAHMVKIFPANQLGPSYLKDVKAPLSDIEVLATGGISADNIGDYKKAGASGFGIGSAVFKRERILSQDWDWVRAQIKEIYKACEDK